MASVSVNLGTIVRRTPKQLLSSLAVQLLLRLLVALGLVLAVYALASFRATKGQLTDLMETEARGLSGLVLGATHYGMLTNHGDEVQRVIQKLAAGPYVADIRVYDKRGIVAFSAAPEEIGSHVEIESQACQACHQSVQPLADVPPGHGDRFYDRSTGDHVFGMISAIPNEVSCAQASCHAHPADQQVLGVLDVRVSAAPLDLALKTQRNNLLWATLANLVVLGVVFGVFAYQLIRRPLAQLHQATRRVSSGDLDIRIDEAGNNELALLARDFNLMTGELRRARQESQSWAERLENKVVEKTAELARVQRQSLHVEKMASLGQLSATVAHELNNPLFGMVTYARLLSRMVDGLGLPEAKVADIQRYLQFIHSEARRCGDIVRNLLTFARQSGQSFQRANLEQVLDKALMVVDHALQRQSVEVRRVVDASDPVLWCDASQLEQVFVALLINAIEALGPEGQGRIEARIRDLGESLVVEICDTGVGIAEEDIPRLFEPFFTTKEETRGVGLGLSVVYGIVARHGGRVDVRSTPGQGATFTVSLPRVVPGASGTESDDNREVS